MRSLLGNKHFVLFLALLALGALTVLATSLEAVPFREAQRFAPQGTEESEVVPPGRSLDWQQATVEDNILVWTLIAVIVALIGVLLSPELRKQMLKMFLRVALIVATVLFLSRNYGDRLFAPESEPVGGPAAPGMSAPLPVFEPPEVSSSFSYLVSFVVALFWLVLIWVVYRLWMRFRQPKSNSTLDEFARIARSSLDQLSSGQNSSDVIINCYLRMSDVVSDKRSLQRLPAMTPHEFAIRLEQAGLPGDAVKRLTRLFETVRYGDRTSGPKDVNEAVSCLNTILHYCGELV